uniref:Box C/D snoRNA protein 1 n=1 Tax=Cacopsylla melanoneura TaxID=428564 RepID=A0A8D8XUJ3_9HEMI
MDDNSSHAEDKTPPRLGYCEVCAIDPAKYTCPKCELKTCCLNCINIHKKELECDGVRNKVKFVQMQKFSSLELQNDFNLLEQVSNSLFKYKRDPVKNSGFLSYNNLPYPLHILRKYAFMRKTQLRYLPKLFSKHKVNSSCVYKNKLYWRVEWVFVSANVKHVDVKLIDSTRLCVAMKTHLENPDLAFYKSAGTNGLLVLMKVEKSPKYYMLDNSLSIAENLRNKVILEFPIFHVIFSYEKDMFDIEDVENIDINSHRNRKARTETTKMVDLEQSIEDEPHNVSEENNINMDSEDVLQFILEPKNEVLDGTDHMSMSYENHEYDY